MKKEITHRIRRGKEVEIPEEWRGKITHRQTIGKRASKGTHKRRREAKWKIGSKGKIGRDLDAQEARAPQVEEWL